MIFFKLRYSLFLSYQRFKSLFGTFFLFPLPFSSSSFVFLHFPTHIIIITTAMDFCQSEPDFTKVPLYQPDQLMFLHKDDPPLFTGTEDPTTSHTPPCSSSSSTSAGSASSSSSSAWPPSSYDLQQVLLQYRSQPDLLQLILESKLQEDRRRTEEARLRAKELDLMLLQHHHQGPFTTTSLLSSSPSVPPTSSTVAGSSPSLHQTASSITSLKHSDSFNTTDNASDDLDEALFLQQMTQR